MQQIIFFFVRNKNFLLFLLLFSIAVGLTIQTHSFHSTRYVNSSAGFAGQLHKFSHGISSYFNLKSENLKLQEENSLLRNQIYNIETVSKAYPADSSLYKYKFRPAQVISNQYNKSHNFLTINKGKRDSIETDMGVATTNGIVGIVNKTSNKYASVQSILHKNTQINAKLKNTNHFGIIVWKNIKDPLRVNLVDIPRHTNLKIGDTVVTGGRSTIFPENLPIGSVSKAELDEMQNTYHIEVELFVDMTSLNAVYIIENKDKNEIEELENATN